MSPQPHKGERIGIIEDDLVVGGTLAHRLELEGYMPLWWRTGQEALEGLHTRPDLVVCDIVLPDMSGEDVFLQALPQLGGKPFLFVTGFGKVEDAVRLMKAGAVDYIVKPYALSDLLEQIARLIKLQPRTAGDLGTSEAMRQVEMLLRRVADIDSSLLITGESGVGKEVAAKFVHQISTRADEPFIAVNCGAIPNDLIESQLFGHERGAFTTSRVRRTRPQWHPVPRRGRRAANADAGEAAPPDPGARLHPRGGRDRDQVGRTDHLRDQYRPRSRSRGGLLPTGSLLSDQCDSCRHPASSRPVGRHPAARP